MKIPFTLVTSSQGTIFYKSVKRWMAALTQASDTSFLYIEEKPRGKNLSHSQYLFVC